MFGGVAKIHLHLIPCYYVRELFGQLIELPDDGSRTRIAKTAHDERGVLMAWVVLVLSGMMEAVWATALGKSDGFSHPIPTIVFFIGLAASMVGLGWATKTLPIGTAYAVWVGIGAALTVIYAMVTGAEAVSVAKVVLIAALVGCVVGLKLVSESH